MLTVLYEYKCELCLFKCTGEESKPPDRWIQLSKPFEQLQDRLVHVYWHCEEQINAGYHAGLKR